MVSLVYLCLIYTILISPAYVVSQCTTGFTNESSLSSIPLARSLPRAGYQLLFLSVKFSCAAQITRFVIPALTNPNISGQSTQYPYIQIYRPGSSNTYNRVYTIGAITEEVTSIGNITNSDDGNIIMDASLYEYTPINQTITVLPNDVLGMFVIPSNSSNPRTQIIPYFGEVRNGPQYVELSATASSNFSNISAGSNLQTQWSPLIAIDITVLSSTPSPSMPSTSVMETSSVSETTTSSMSDLSSFMETISESLLTSTSTSEPSLTSILTSDSLSTTVISMSSTTSVSISMSSTPSVSISMSSTPSVSISMTSTPSVSVSMTVSNSPTVNPSLNIAAIAGIIVAIILVFIIVGLIFVLILLFAVGKKRSNKKTFTPSSATLDNPTYTGVDHGMVSNVSTLSGGNNINHYEVPNYRDPVDSPVGFYDVARSDKPNGFSSIYHELGPDDIEASHYEMNLQNGLYQSTEGYANGIYEMEPVSGYEQPVSSRTGTLKNTTVVHNHYDAPEELVGQLTSALLAGPGHDYSVLDEGICVPTDEERQVMLGQNSRFDEQIYSQIKDFQKQKYDNVTFFEESDIYWRPATQASILYDQLARRKYREIPRNQIKIVKHLGSGQFGTVNEGVWHSPQAMTGVAVKLLTKNSSEIEKVKLLQEAAIMGQFSHPNVVQLHGVVTVGEPVMIIIELMRKGDLHNYLKSIRPKYGDVPHTSLPSQLLEFCKQVARGMKYLSKKSFVHRDLAARNVFLDENYICKIGDFGMSRDLEDEHYYVSHGGKIPVKWTAPEALQYKRYSSASDVFSYAALLYEIWSLGHKPFEGFSNPQTVDMVQSGYRLPPPAGCPRGIYQLMIHCWHPDSSRRPTFDEIVKDLSENTYQLLSWRDIDKSVHAQASVLGAPLEAGHDLYPELQQTFIKYTIKY